jgi:hypothetical protein
MSNQTLALLVGSNPLPYYLSACALRPRRIVLLYTEQTSEAKVRLWSELQCALDGVSINDLLVKDATCATEVRRAVDSLLQNCGVGDVLLNYTGGTKVMAAHALLAFSVLGGQQESASYLDEGGTDLQPRLRFDDGNSVPLSKCPDVSLELRTALALHGITHKPRGAKDPAPTTADAREILCKVLQSVPCAAVLYSERIRLETFRNPKIAASMPFRASTFGLNLSLQEFPTNEQLERFGNADQRKSWFKQWCSFIGGEWLEEWLGAQISALALKPAPEITVGVNAFRGHSRVPLEVDVAVIRGQRSYFVSCTTDTGKPICKSKLFEVAVRSRQLGGDLARAALVCLADDPVVSALQADVDDMWGASNTTKVFGLSDIRAWSDCEDKQPNRCSLQAWLES